MAEASRNFEFEWRLEKGLDACQGARWNLDKLVAQKSQGKFQIEGIEGATTIVN